MIVAIATALFCPNSARAACSSPAANIGALDFQTSVFKYCDGTNWQPLGATPSFPLLAPNGSATMPSYSFSAGTNTGIYSTGAGTIAFTTSGSLRASMDATGIRAEGTSFSIIRSTNTAFQGSYSFFKDRAGAIVQNGDELGYIDFQGWDGTTHRRGALIYSLVDGTPGSNDMPTRLSFWTTPDGTGSPTERMRIDNAGNVGIGTTPPDAQYRTIVTPTAAQSALNVRGDTGATSDAFSRMIGFTDRALTIQYATMGQSSTGFGLIGNNMPVTISGMGSPVILAPTTINGGTVTANVGIGTTSPAAKLSVQADSNYFGASEATQIQINGLSNTNKRLRLGYDTTANAGVIQAVTFGTSWDPLLLNAGGGNVGIGTTVPAGLFDIRGTTPVLYISDASNLNSTTNYSGYLGGRDSSGTESWWVGDGTSGAKAVTLHAPISGYSVGMSNASGSMILDSSGKVGIGTAAAQTTLEVYTNTTSAIFGSYPTILVNNPAAAGYAAIALNKGTGAAAMKARAYIDGSDNFFVGTYASKPMVLTTGDSERVRIDTSGNVGIGTTNPQAKLDVNGSVRLGDPTANSGVATLHGLNWAWYGLYLGSTRRGFFQASTTTFDLFSEAVGVPMILYTEGTEKMRIAPNGNVGIGTTNPGYTLHVVGNAGLSTGTAWTNASDGRLKTIDGNYEYGLDEILKLRTVRFHYKDGNALGLPSSHPMTGFVAQEVQTVIPDAVSVGAKGYLQLNVDPIHWATVNAVQELHGMCRATDERVDAHDREIASLKEENEKIRKDNAKIKDENLAIKSYLCAKDPAAPFCPGRRAPAEHPHHK